MNNMKDVPCSANVVHNPTVQLHVLFDIGVGICYIYMHISS